MNEQRLPYPITQGPPNTDGISTKDIAKEIRDTLSEPLNKGPRDEKNRIIITYTFDSQELTSAPNKDITTDKLSPEKLPDLERQLVRRKLDEFESVIDVVFVEAKPQEAHLANFRFMKAAYETKDKTSDGKPSGMAYASTTGKTRNIVFNTHHPLTNATTAHEIMHALGYDHAGSDGTYDGSIKAAENPKNSKDITVLSYLAGAVSSSGLLLHLAPGDVAAAQKDYGKSRKAASPVIRSDTLSQRLYIYETEPVTIDFTQSYQSGTLSFENDRISGAFKNYSNSPDEVRVRTVETPIRDILADSHTMVEITAIGNKLANRLQGGMKPDTLVPRGDDTLTGNGAADTFIIDEKSGRGNSITDFSFLDDKLLLKPPIAKVDLHHETVTVEGRPCSGTMVDCLNVKGKPLASVFIAGMTPKQIRDYLLISADTRHIEAMISKPGPDVKTTDPKLPNSPPPGLPQVPGSSQKSK